MKNSPKISVIITNYNYGRYITAAIQSVLSQSYKNIELIIINDGSTDDSDKIIKRIIDLNLDRDIKYVNRENRGIVYTRNEGIKLATGEYISYLDADDYFNRNYIGKSYRIAKEFDADVVYPNWHFVGEWLGRPDTNFPEFKPELLQLQKLHVTPASLIKRSVIIDRMFEAEKVAEDWDFFIGLSLTGAKFKLAKDNYLNYRIRKGTRGSKNDPREDTEHFVQILDKYRSVHGSKIINSSKLVSDRHPSIVKQVLRMRLPRLVIHTIRNEGPKATSRKIVGKLASKNKLVWSTVGYARNKKYNKMIKSYQIETSDSAKLAVVVHLYYPELWPLIKDKLANINVQFDLFVSVQIKDKNISLDRVNDYHLLTNIVAFPNRGRDMLPFLIIARKISQYKQYEYILKLHTKKSLHRTDGNEWLNSLLEQLIPNDISPLIKTLRMTNTGSIGPADHVVSLSKYMGGNRNLLGYIMEKITDEKTIEQVLFNQSKYPFFGGSMFWCRVDFLEPLLNASITPADFNTEKGQVDATTAHAIERLLGKTMHTITGKKIYTVKKTMVSQLPDKSYNSNYKYVG